MYTPTGTDRAFIKAIDMLDRREINPYVADIYNETEFLDFMDMTGRAERSSVPEYHNYVNDQLFENITVGSVSGTAGAGNPTTVTLAAGSHQNSGKESYPIVGDLVKTATGEQGLVVAKDTTTDSAHTITINTDSATNFRAAVAANDVLVFYSNAAAEQTGSPDPRSPKVIKYSGQMQTFKNSYVISAKQKASETEIVMPNGSRGYFYKGAADSLMLHRLQETFGLLWGNGKTITDANGKEVPTTRGLEHEIIDNGVTHNLSAAFTTTDWKTVDSLMNKNRMPSSYSWWLGHEAYRDVDDLITSLPGLTAGGISYNGFGGSDPKKKAIELGFNSITRYGRSLHLKRMSAFNHPKVSDATSDYKYAKTSFLIPLDKVKQDLSGKKLDRIKVRYLNNDGTDLRYDESYTGKFAPGGATNDISECRVHYESTCGLQCHGSQHFMRLNPTY